MASENHGFCQIGVYDLNENSISISTDNIQNSPNDVNQIYDNGVYENEIENQHIQTNVAAQLPKYEDLCKPGDFKSQVPPPQYSQPQPLVFVQSLTTQPLSFPQSQTLQLPPRNLVGGDTDRLKYEKLHLIFGVLSLVFGSIIMILDPLIPAIFQYYYSMFPAGLFMVISGICSIHSSKKNNKCSLKASLTFDVFALILLFVGYIMGIVAAGNPTVSARCIFTPCLPSINFYMNGIQGFAIFHAVFGIILFVLILWDSTLKCGTLCCKNRN